MYKTSRILQAGLLLAASTPALSAQDLLIPMGAAWSYLDDGSDQGSAWRDPLYDDLGWLSGPAQLGYGEGDEATVVSFGPDPDDRHITTYFRHQFDVPDPSVYQSLELRVLRDDGAVMYVNGVELARSGMLDGPVDSSTISGSTVAGINENVFYTHHVPSGALVAGPNVLAVEIHQRSPRSNDLSFELELLGHQTRLLVRGPYLQLPTSDAVTIRWRTSAPTVGFVRYGDDPANLVTTVTEAAATIEHEVRVTGLTPGAEVFYAIGDGAEVLAGGDVDHVVRTAPALGARMPFRAWVLGDSGEANADAANVRDAYLAHVGGGRTDLLLLLGDSAYEMGDDAQFQRALFDFYGDVLRQTPFLIARGNHERSDVTFDTIFSMPDAGQGGGVPSGTELYFSFDWANVHFVCLDSYSSSRSVGGSMWNWTQADLAATTQDWIVVFFHHPPYSKGNADSDTDTIQTEMRENFMPLFEQYGVALVFAGHSHSYERTYLIDGHYGDSLSFDPATMVLDGGDGSVSGTGAYTRTPGPHAGTVAVVTGSASSVLDGPLDHPAMLRSIEDLGSVVLEVFGGRMDVLVVDDEQQIRDSFTLLNETWDGTYCAGSVNGEGCVASVSTSGAPSVSSGQPFLVRADDVRTQAFGLLYYGFGAEDGGPFLGGRFCVRSPFRRVAAAFSGGTAPCEGSLEVDLQPYWTSPLHPGLDPGTTLCFQYWHRDTTSFGSSVTEAVSFVVEP